MKFHGKKMTLGLIVVSTAVALAGCGGSQHSATQSNAGGIPVQVQTLKTVHIPQTVTLPGVVISSDRVAISSRLMGYLRTLSVHVGQQVKAGQILFTVDPTSIRAQIARVQAGLTQAQANLSTAQSTYRRFAPLVKTDAVSPQEFDRIRAGRTAALARVTAAKAALTAARSQLDYAEVRAPTNGIVSRKMANVGDLVTPGHPVLTLENPANRQVRFVVTRSTYTRMKLGESIRAQGSSGYVSETKLNRLVATVDPITHTHLAKALLPTSAPFPVGAYVNIRIPLGDTMGLTIPVKAIVIRAGLRGTFVVNPQGRAQFRMIRTGEAVSTGNLVVLSGLVAGERLVTHAPVALANGDKLHVEGTR